MAASVKGVVTIAYWDTEGGSRPPRLLGDYQGTPTIRLFKPKRKQRVKGSSAEKDALDYQHGERTAKDLRKFLEYQLPNFVEKVKAGSQDLERVRAKADKYGLPVAVLFTTKPNTSTTVKWLSVEFRRRMLVVEVAPTEKNRGVREELLSSSSSMGESGDGGNETLPALYVIPPSPSSVITAYGGETFSRRKLQEFLEEHALKNPVLEPVAAASKTEENDTEQNDTPPPSKQNQKQSVGGDEF